MPTMRLFCRQNSEKNQVILNEYDIVASEIIQHLLGDILVNFKGEEYNVVTFVTI